MKMDSNTIGSIVLFALWLGFIPLLTARILNVQVINFSSGLRIEGDGTTFLAEETTTKHHSDQGVSGSGRVTTLHAPHNAR
jgi:hypothetical protein